MTLILVSTTLLRPKTDEILDIQTNETRYRDSSQPERDRDFWASGPKDSRFSDTWTSGTRHLDDRFATGGHLSSDVRTTGSRRLGATINVAEPSKSFTRSRQVNSRASDVCREFCEIARMSGQRRPGVRGRQAVV
ncbi:hypothetical protein OUZ56_005642 [Daphnia magna]|uniref:Uncharacterized protein n=1 Tax=Daphnia magna TaxID=35525 RepID=A0ABQ9YTC1_9CRUS|nr:hypothetical protein OUZ56_005642 [Daphnia magna]